MGIPAGINFREGKEGTDFTDKNPFLPHRIVMSKNEDFNKKYNYVFKLNNQQYLLRKKLYKHADDPFTFDTYMSFNLRLAQPKIGALKDDGTFVSVNDINFVQNFSMF